MPEKVDLVEKELLLEAELLRTEGLTEAELKRAKSKIIGQKKISRQDLGHLASTTDQHIDAEDALYEAVTLEQVKAAAVKYLKPESAIIAIINRSKPKPKRCSCFRSAHTKPGRLGSIHRSRRGNEADSFMRNPSSASSPRRLQFFKTPNDDLLSNAWAIPERATPSPQGAPASRRRITH